MLPSPLRFPTGLGRGLVFAVGLAWSVAPIVEAQVAAPTGNALARQVVSNPRFKAAVGVFDRDFDRFVNELITLESDMRAVSPTALKDIDAQFKKILADAVAAENAARSTVNGKITAELTLVGDRPSGTTSPDSPELKQIAAMMGVFDKVPVWEVSSTDANLPISLGIQAFAIGRSAGGKGGRGHSLDEWVDVEKTQAVKDFELAAALILSLADLP